MTVATSPTGTTKTPATLTAQAPGAVDPGYTTTEFWQSTLVTLIGAAVAIGSVFDPSFNLDGVQAIVPAVAVAAAAIAQLFYTTSRAKVKSAAQMASAQAGGTSGPPGNGSGGAPNALAASPNTSQSIPTVLNVTLPAPTPSS